MNGMIGKHGTVGARLAVVAGGALLVLGVLAACEHAPSGIFADIARSRDISRPNDGDRGYASSMIKHATRYYATAKKLFVRDSSAHGRDWGEIGLPGGYDIATAVNTVTVGANSFPVVAVASSSSGNSALYELRVDGSGNHSWGDNLYRCDRNGRGDCTTVNTTAAAPDRTTLTTLTQQIVWMGVARFSAGAGDPRLFVLAKGGAKTNPQSYVLYYYHSGGDAATGNDRLHAVWNPSSLLIDVETIGNYIVFADRTTLYCLNDTRGSSAGVTGFTGLNQNPTGGTQRFELRKLIGGSSSGSNADASARTIGGLLHQGGALHVSGGDGQIFRYNGTTACQSSWYVACSSSITANCWSKSMYSGAFRYTDMAWYGQLESSSVGGMVIGVEDAAGNEGGYRQIKRAGTTDNIAGLTAASISNPNNNSNYRSSKLSVTTVNSFFVDAMHLFALTDGYGIWRATYTSGLPSWSVDLSR